MAICGRTSRSATVSPPFVAFRSTGARKAEASTLKAAWPPGARPAWSRDRDHRHTPERVAGKRCFRRLYDPSHEHGCARKPDADARGPLEGTPSPGPAQGGSSTSTAKIITFVAGRLPFSAKRPARPKIHVSQAHIAKPPPQPLEGVRSAEVYVVLIRRKPMVLGRRRTRNPRCLPPRPPNPGSKAARNRPANPDATILVALPRGATLSASHGRTDDRHNDRARRQADLPDDARAALDDWLGLRRARDRNLGVSLPDLALQCQSPTATCPTPSSTGGPT